MNWLKLVGAKLWAWKKRLLSLAVLAAGRGEWAMLLSAFIFGGGSESEGETETVYRESSVTRGDITVGVTESATATLKLHNMTFDISSEVEEVYVKAGQTVKEGDPLVLLSATSIQEQLNDLRADYQETLAELTEAEVAKQKGELEAKSTYNSTLNSSDNADSTYELTVEKLERAVEKAEKELEDIQTEIRTYTKMLNNFNSYDSVIDNYVSAQEWYNAAQEWVDSAQELLNDHKKEHGGQAEDGCVECTRLQENLDSAKADLAYAKLEYEDAGSEFSTKYYNISMTDEDDIRDARDDARERLIDAEASLKEAEYNLQAQTQDAQLTLEEREARAEMAEDTYALELTRLENNVTSKQTLVDNVNEQIVKYEGYLASNLITAPCDGIVTNVNYEAGDEVNANNTIVSVSDSANVYVYIAVTQDDITDISLEQAVTLTMDAFEEITFDGFVDSITTTPVRSATGSASYTVTIRAAGDGVEQIYEGMTGSVTLVTRQQKDVLYVTNRSVYQNDEGISCVKIKAADGTLVETPVTTGFSDGRNVEITSGLSEGQTVIIESQVVTG